MALNLTINKTWLKNAKLYSTLEDKETKFLAKQASQNNLDIIRRFKDDHRNLVYLFKFNGKKYIYKEPKERNNRKWERFLTLFRPSESTRFFLSSAKLLKLGLKCPTPVLSYEETLLGMVIKSFFIYEFIEGDPAYSSHKEQVFLELKKLHNLGYTRRDPNLNNFILNEKGIYFIDFKLNKPFIFAHTRIKLEKILFNEKQPKSIAPTRKLNLPLKQNLAYYLAKIFLTTKGKTNHLKNKLKGIFKKNSSYSK